MKTAIFSFCKKKPWGSFLLSLASLFILIAGFFFFGTYIDSISASWWSALILFILLLLLGAPAFVYQIIYYTSCPKLSLGRFSFGRAFLLLFGIMVGCLLTFLADLPFYLLDLYSWTANGSFGALGLSFVIISLVSLSCVGAGLRETFSAETTIEPPSSAVKAKSFADKVNGFLPYFLISYFLLIVLPYCFALVPAANAFFTGSLTKIAFRAFTCAYFFVYSFLLAKGNHSRINIPWLVILSLLICFYCLAWATVPTSYAYYTLTFEHGFTFHWGELGQLYIVISLGTFILECAVFLCLISFFPQAVKSRKAVIYPLVCVVLFALFGCLFSYIFDGSLYLDTLRGLSVEKNAIRSIFHSKNAYGIFLFLGCLSSIFLVWYLRKNKWIFVFTAFLFLITAGVVKCYTAFVPALILVVALLLALLFKLRKRHQMLFIVLLTSLVVVTIVFFVLVYTPAVREKSKVLLSLFNNLQSISSGEVLSRTKLWDYCLSLIRGPFVLLGETDVVANSQLTMIEQMAGDATYDDFHSAFVSFYSGYGLAGLMVYLGMHAYALKGIHSIRKNQPEIWLVTLALFFGSVLFTMPETYMLFVNMSASVFPINLLLLVYPKFLASEPNVLDEPIDKKKEQSYAQN